VVDSLHHRPQAVLGSGRRTAGRDMVIMAQVESYSYMSFPKVYHLQYTVTEPSESIHTLLLIPHFVVLQLQFKIDKTDIFFHPSTHNTL
jgi:hypothetical protein